MHILLLVAHGSRRAASNEEVRELAARLESISWDRFDKVIPAFLELAEPEIPEGIDACVAAGATQVTVLPYFLSAGRHVAHDIPEELEKAQANHPQLPIRVANYIGQNQEMPMLLLQAALGDTTELKTSNAADAVSKDAA
jgi:sirohydrochlorin ferrochelatase